ncbi:MAG: ATP-dependent RecD-like DNA helicase, partial [Lachnospiraceae bacterium]
IIIDEMSMVDIYLMKALLSAITVGTRLVLVGDVCQLPSVGPGAVLKDIISSECFPVVELLNIFRQATESDIVVNAHRINHGQEIRLDNQSADFFFLQRTQTEVIVQSVVYLVQSKLPPYVQATPFDIQVLTPMRKGALGVENLNRVLQRHLNPPSAQRDEKEHRDGVFRVGDKVMQIKNNYQLEWHVRNSLNILVDQGMGVFNGDMGIITEIDDFAQTVTVLFDELREVLYPYALLDELELAYAVTIHKSQGSEYPAVVLPLLSGPHMLFNRSLLYTAVTRARRCVTIVGDRETVRGMIDNESEQRRFSGLCWQIREMGGADCRSVP